MNLQYTLVKIPAILVFIAIVSGCIPVQEASVKAPGIPRLPVEKHASAPVVMDQRVPSVEETGHKVIASRGPSQVTVKNDLPEIATPALFELSTPQIDLAASEDISEPLEAPEPELTLPQEVDELEKLGKWEEGQSAKEVVAPEVTFDFPITVNRQVEYYLDFFQNRHRSNFRKWLSRSTRYLPMIEKTFSEAGLPLDLAYLAMIESGFNEAAYSRARAVGMWQFMKATGRHFDLKANSYVDERRNPVKSTVAAAAYLSELHQEFDSWYLAVAAYNAGEGKIRRAIKKYKTKNFWKLAEGKYLRSETKLYVPKLIAAIMIAKEPEKYGFYDIPYEAAMTYDTVEVPRWTALKAVALAAGMPEDTLRRMNRQLRKPFTPPDSAVYELKVPAGKREMTAKNLPRVHATVSTNFKTHVVRNGESLDNICKRYGLAKTILLKANTIGVAPLQAGQRLRIPFRTTEYELLPEGMVAEGYALAESTGADFVLHKIRPGESISSISRKYNVPAHLIAAWNDLKDVGRIRAGKHLALYVKEAKGFRTADYGRNNSGGIAKKSSFQSTGQSTVGQSAGTTILKKGQGPNEISYKIKSGDSLWSIARQHKVSMNDIRRWNNLDRDLLRPGNRLVLKVAALADESSLRDTYYQVRSGDSLWTIARRHNLSTDSIKRWNNLQNNTIHPGKRLLLKVAKDYSG